MGLIPGWGRFPWRRKWQPTPVLLPGQSHGWRNLVGYSPGGRKESETTEATQHLSQKVLQGNGPQTLVPWEQRKHFTESSPAFNQCNCCVTCILASREAKQLHSDSYKLFSWYPTRLDPLGQIFCENDLTCSVLKFQQSALNFFLVRMVHSVSFSMEIYFLYYGFIL